MTPNDIDRKLVLETLEAREPELWRRCYPRIYEEPSICGKYYSPKTISTELIATALRVRQEGLGGQSQIAEILWASRLASLRVPTFWIGHDMAQAIQQTAPPMLFDWANEKLPFEAIAFMVPKGALVHEEKSEGEAVFVSFVRSKKGDEIPNLSPSGPKFFHVLEDAFSCFVYTSSEALMHWTYATKDGRGGCVNLSELDKLVQDFATHDHTTYSKFSASLTLADNRLLAKVSHFVFGTILMMLTKPEFVTPAALRKRVPTKASSAPKEFWSPNVLGMHYRIKCQSQGGTHASPRMHWVRGANREQPYGEGHLLRKRKWIEPYLRGFNPRL